MSLQETHHADADASAISPRALARGGIYSTYWDASTGWNSGWFAVPGKGGAQTGAVVTALARNPNHLDLFLIGTNGEVFSTFWDAAGGWSPGWFGLPSAIAPLGTPVTVTALARTPENLDLFLTGQSGETFWTTWNAAGWAGSWTDLGGGTMPGSPIAGNTRNANRMDLFCIGGDGRVYSRYWNGAWSPWASNLSPAAPAKSSIGTAIFETYYIGPFFTATNGRIYGTSYYMGPVGSSAWFEVPGGIVVKPGSPVTVLERDTQHVDLFVTGTNGVVYTTSWGPSANPAELWSGIWIPIPGLFTTEGAPVTAVSRYPTHTDLFVTDETGRICSTWWDATVGWVKSGWFQVPGGSVSIPAAPVTVVSRNPNHLDLFVIG